MLKAHTVQTVQNNPDSRITTPALHPPNPTGFSRQATGFGMGILCLLLAIPASGKSALEAGITNLRDGKTALAARLLENAVEKDPTNSAARCNLGIACLKLGKFDQAEAEFRVAAELAPTDPRPWEFTAAALRKQRRWEEAREMLHQALRRLPTSARAVTALAAVEFEAGDLQTAETLLTRALTINPKYAPALYNVALLHRNRGQNNAAASYYGKYLQQAPLNPHAENARAFLRSHTGLGMLKEARPPAPQRTGRSHGADTPPPSAKPAVPTPQTASPALPLFEKARHAIDAERFDEALTFLNQAIKADPTHRDSLWQLALLYDQHLHLESKARATYERFKARFPDDPRIQKTPQKPSD